MLTQQYLNVLLPSAFVSYKYQMGDQNHKLCVMLQVQVRHKMMSQKIELIVFR